MVLALTAGGTLAFYAYTTYLQKFLVNTSGFPRKARRRSPRLPCLSSCSASRSPDCSRIVSAESR